MRNLGQTDKVYMEEPLAGLRREVGRIYADPLTRRRKELSSPGVPITDEAVVMCRHCGAFVRLIGIPPEVEPGGPMMMLYYPLMYCPVCGVDIGRALGVERIDWPIVGAPIYHLITCTRCGSKLRYKTQALAPQYLRTLQCPVCGNSLEVEGLEVEILEAEPWPMVAEEPKEIPWKPIIIVGSVFAMLFTAIGIGHLIESKKK